MEALRSLLNDSTSVVDAAYVSTLQQEVDVATIRDHQAALKIAAEERLVVARRSDDHATMTYFDPLGGRIWTMSLRLACRLRPMLGRPKMFAKTPIKSWERTWSSLSSYANPSVFRSARGNDVSVGRRSEQQRKRKILQQADSCGTQGYPIRYVPHRPPSLPAPLKCVKPADDQIGCTFDSKSGDPVCGICGEAFRNTWNPYGASQTPTSSSRLPFGKILPCASGHGYCLDCLTSYIRGKLDEGGPDCMVFPIRCPECPPLLWQMDDKTAGLILSPELLNHWHHQKLMDDLPKVGIRTVVSHSRIIADTGM